MPNAQPPQVPKSKLTPQQREHFEDLLITWPYTASPSVHAEALRKLQTGKDSGQVFHAYEKGYGVGHYDDRKTRLTEVLARLERQGKADFDTVLAWKIHEAQPAITTTPSGAVRAHCAAVDTTAVPPFEKISTERRPASPARAWQEAAAETGVPCAG